jgi:hypothetical protein
VPRGIGLPDRPCRPPLAWGSLPANVLARGVGGPLAAPAHSRQQGRRETPDRCFSTPPLTRKGCPRAAAAAVRCPNGCIPFEIPARSGSAPLLDEPIL